MNDERKRNRWHVAIVIAVVVGVLALILALAVPAFIPSRNTAARDACIRNLRLIDEAKRKWESGQSMSARKKEETNASQASQAIGAPQPER
jgi:uncharacterized membrane protein YedE/YeeE